MNPKTVSRLWILTATIALALAISTLVVLVPGQERNAGSQEGVIVDVGSPVYLRQSPGPSQAVLTILTVGTQVEILGEGETDGEVWLHISTDKHSGWVLLRDVQREEP